MTGGVYIVKCVHCGRKRRFVDADDVADVCEDCRTKLNEKRKGSES